MTIREQFNALLKQKDEECLDVFYKKYQLIFKMPVNTLTTQIIKTFKEKDKTLKINPIHEVIGNYYEMQNWEESKIYDKTISTSISIEKAGKIEKIVLLKNSTAKNQHNFQIGEYQVDIFELLLNQDIKYKEIFHKACWKAVSENLKDFLINSNFQSNI